MRILRGFWAVCLAVLLSVQISIAFQPDARSTVTLSETEVLLQLCSTPGASTTLIFDTASGETREAPAGDATQGADCPYCVVGAAFFVADVAAPAREGKPHRAEIAPSATEVLLTARFDFSRTSRAPPLSI
ncbi:DUF2946 domain-containing protein [Celeribacter neptunius]|nr:DUF2946 domain-containing protein [Celeribacter neptunius]